MKLAENNNTNNTITSNRGTIVLGLLGLIFVMLKLAEVIDWSWWLVTAPFLGGLSLLLAVAIIGVLGVTVLHLWNDIMDSTEQFGLVKQHSVETLYDYRKKAMELG